MSDRLSEIEGRLAAATPGPWEVVGLTADGGYAVDTAAHNGLRYEVVPEAIEEDAELIAHAPADLAALVAAVKAVRALHHSNRQETACQECRGDWPCFTAAVMSAALDQS